MRCKACGAVLSDLESPTKLCSYHYFTGHIDAGEYVQELDIAENGAAVWIDPASNGRDTYAISVQYVTTRELN